MVQRRQLPISDLRKRIRPVIRPAVILLAVAIFLIGLIGFCRQYYNMPDDVRGKLDWSLPFYKTVQLFLLNSGAEDDSSHESNYCLFGARLLVVLLYIVVSVAAIERAVDDVLTLWRQWMQKNHVVICGLGQIGLQLLDDLHGATPTSEVVVIENNPANPWLEYARSNGATVVIGDSTRAETLENALASHAAEVFVVNGDDGVNLEVVAELASLLKKNSASGDTLKVYVHLVDVNFATAMGPNITSLRGESRMQLRVFNVPRAAATRLITEQVIQHAPKTPNEVAHYIIVGFGAMGQVLAVQLAQLAHFANKQRSRMTIADQGIQQSAQGFLARFPRFTAWTQQQLGVTSFSHSTDAWSSNSHQLPADIRVPYDEAVQYACNAEFVDLPGGTCGEQFVKHIAAVCTDDDVQVKPIIFVCGQRDRENYETAQRIRRQLQNQPELTTVSIPIFVWLPRQPALADNIRKESGLLPFGECRASASYDEVTKPRREQLGQALQVDYEENQATANSNYRREPWENLGEDFKESNRAAADHAIIKLAALGKQLRHPPQPTLQAPPLLAPNSDQENLLAEMEHNRWVAERLLADWRYFPAGANSTDKEAEQDDIKDKKKLRLNRNITPWEQLKSGEPEKDSGQVRTVLHVCQTKFGVEPIKAKVTPPTPG